MAYVISGPSSILQSQFAIFLLQGPRVLHMHIKPTLRARLGEDTLFLIFLLATPPTNKI